MQNSTQRKPPASLSWYITTIAGIEIKLHASSIIIFLLVSTGLNGLLTSWYPEAQRVSIWAWAFVGSSLLLVSLLIHELAHSMTATYRGVGVRSITLFLFGGIAELEGEPQTPKDEFLIAGAGPLASLLLAIIFFAFAGLLQGEIDINTHADGTLDMANLPITAGIALWLSAINFILAVFNLLPGFPMDGGRLFRAVLWWRTNDLTKATLQASKVGQRIGWLIIFWGVWVLSHGNVGKGIWTILIGWFIHHLAAASRTQALINETLGEFSVTDLMRTRFETVPANLSIPAFIDNYVLRSKQVIWPTELDNGTAGFVAASDFDLTSEFSNSSLIDEFIIPLSEDNSLTTSCRAQDALQKLARNTNPLPVVENNRIVGILDNSDVIRWLARHSNNRID